MRRTLLVAAVCASGSATAVSPPEPVLRTVLPSGYIDWAELKLVVTAQSDRRMGAWRDRRIQEQDIVDSLPALVREMAVRVPLTPDTTAGDLLDDDDGGEIAAALEDGLRSWRIAETRYTSSGGVAMDAELDLRKWLRPALRSLATTDAPPAGGDATGLVVDARGLPLEPCLAPRITDATGRVLAGAQLLTEQTIAKDAPVAYVSDPSDPAARRRAGAAPLFARASAVHGCELMLDPGATAVADSADMPAIAALGRIVLVVGR